MGNKKIIIGIGILIILLALAGTVSARFQYGFGCAYCHPGGSPPALTPNGTYFNEIHRFDGIAKPSTPASCTHCHLDPANTNFNLLSNGSVYNTTHRYNDTTLASERLPTPGCNNCHVDVVLNNFDFLTDTPTYLKSTFCENCHKAKYDNWTNTLHRVMLTEKSKAQAMNLPEPEVGWANISYVIVTKFQLAYINTTGYFLAQNDEYNTENMTWENSSHAGGAYGTCGRCHTTNWNASARNSSLPGFNGTFSEPGIACERCHKPAGNGHQVFVNYSGDLCRECHTGSNHGTDWENSKHAPPPYAVGSNCVFCHSPFDKYKNENVTKDNATGVACGVCHNTHNMTDDKYAETFSEGIFNARTWSEVSNAKLGFFNATASIAADTDIFDILVSPALLYPGNDSSRKDISYGTAPINVTGPVSEVLCSKCHYRHGLAHVSGINLTHSRMNYPQTEWATCADCHMAGINASVGKDLMKKHSNYPLKDVSQSCGSTTKCHTSSAQDLNKSSNSIVPIVNEWNQSLHNDKVNGGFFENGTSDLERASSCSKCHSPVNWNPVNGTSLVEADTFKGITCQVCHNIHDMGDWLIKTKAKFGETKAYAWYDRDAIIEATDATGVPTRYKASYAMMANTTELCGNCHANIREGRTAPGWASATAANPISPHGFPAKDIFVGSWKQTVLNFECKDCHMATMIQDSNGSVLPDNQKVKGHSFKVNATILMNGTACSSCHVAGSTLGNLSTTIENIQTETRDKWNTTNLTVLSALAKIKAFNGEKELSRTKIAQAYWNLRMVSSDGSWGVHNPNSTNKLLDDSTALANESLANLGQVGISKTITVSPATATLAINGTQIFNATVMDQNGTPMSGIPIIWASNNTAVGNVFPLTATTDVFGGATTTFTADTAGNAMITAINGTFVGSANVTVTLPVVTSFLLTPETKVTQKGNNTGITITAMNGIVPQSFYNGIANITITAINTSAVNAPINVSLVKGNATIDINSGEAQFVTVAATNGTINGSTIVEFADMVIGLDMGWNLVSIPSFADPSDINQTMKLVQNNGVQTFNPDTTSFVTPTDLQPLYGYWINVTADNQKLGFIADTSVIIEPPTRNLFEGWNMIGVSASRDDTIDSIRLDMTPEAAFADLRNGEQPSQWFYSRLVSFDGAIPRTFTAGVDLTLREPPLKQGHGYWLFIKNIHDTNENNVPWAGKLW